MLTSSYHASLFILMFPTNFSIKCSNSNQVIDSDELPSNALFWSLNDRFVLSNWHLCQSLFVEITKLMYCSKLRGIYFNSLGFQTKSENSFQRWMYFASYSKVMKYYPAWRNQRNHGGGVSEVCTILERQPLVCTDRTREVQTLLVLQPKPHVLSVLKCYLPSQVKIGVSGLQFEFCVRCHLFSEH